MITFCMRLMFNLIRVGKEWAGPVFPHPLKSNCYMCIHDRVRLAEDLPYARQYSPTRYPSEQGCCLTLSGWGKNGPAQCFPTPEKAKVTCVFVTGYGWLCFSQTITIYHMHKSFPPPDNLLNKVDFKPCQGGEKMGRPSFSPPQD